MILFALVVSFTIATADHLRLRDEVIQRHQAQLEQVEETIQYALLTTEKAYELFDQETTNQMIANSHYLLDVYIQNPFFEEWDFQGLKETLGMDIYILDEDYVIIHSSLEADLGLDFKQCCRKLLQVLMEKKEAGEMLIDGLDIEQVSGEAKRYSYMPTPDKKYIIELGYGLQGGNLFQEFNFLQTKAELEERYPSVNEINILNIEGFAFGKPVVEENKLPLDRYEAFEQALSTQEITELHSHWKGEQAIYRYIPYVSPIDRGTTKLKVLEIVYNDHELQAMLSHNRQAFVNRLLLVLIITILISSLLSKWLAKPIYLAFHDNLTGLKNRAAFEQILSDILAKGEGTTALLMIDLDNFKLVNDRLGHDQGDYLLTCVAKGMKALIGKEDIAFRWGGDEFMIIMPNTDQHGAARLAERLIADLQRICAQQVELMDCAVSVSIGISVAPTHGLDPETLCKRADLALYASKEKGKNQYQLYAESSFSPS